MSFAFWGAIASQIAVPLNLPQGFPDPWIDPGFAKFVWVQSPNWNERPVGAVVDTVVVHSTAIPSLRDTALVFARESSQVSAHFTIGKDGSIVGSVSTFKRGWHAGVSRDVVGRNNVNDFSIGIELVNLDDGKDPYPEKQILALRFVIGMLERRFPLKHITSHKFIALPPGRKIDPAEFPWNRLEGLGLDVTP